MKNFDEWNILKKKLEERGEKEAHTYTPPLAKKRDLWWCHLGVDVGSEEDGKNEEFQRPVIIVNKLSPHTYLVVPTTSKQKNNKFRIKVLTEENNFSFALIDQLKVIDGKRLKRKISVVSEKEFSLLIDTIVKEVLNCEIPLARDFSEPEGTVIKV